MLLPDRGEPDDGITPGLIGPVNPRLPSIRDSDPPIPARTQKYIPPALVALSQPDTTTAWARVAMLMAMFAIMLLLAPPGWVDWLMLLAVATIPDRVLQRLIPKPLRKQPTLIQTDSGDTWITHVPSVVAEDAMRSNVRLPFRAMSGLLALLCMWMAMLPTEGMSLSERIVSFLGGMVFGGIALVPGGDVKRMLPRISTAPRLPAPADDADAGGAGVADFQNSGSGLKIDG